MKYEPCSHVKYTGHAPLFTQSVERVRYGWSKANGFVCQVSNPKHMIFLVSRVAKLIPVVPVAETSIPSGGTIEGTTLTEDGKKDTVEVKPKKRGRPKNGKK